MTMPRITAEGFEEIGNILCEKLGIPPVKVKYNNKIDLDAVYSWDGIIYLRQTRVPSFVLLIHEIAHHLWHHRYYFKDPVPMAWNPNKWDDVWNAEGGMLFEDCLKDVRKKVFSMFHVPDFEKEEWRRHIS